METPDDVVFLELECTCVGISQNRWDELMKGATRANHNLINKLVKRYLPNLYDDLCLEFMNPYHYYKTKTHLILVHSSIEYFIKYQ